MALIHVHKIMIGTALVFCALFSARSFWLHQGLMGAFFAASTVGLAAYLRWFLQTKAHRPGDRSGDSSGEG